MSADVTVVIPVWDAYVPLLVECVETVLAQEGPDATVVIVDNASTMPLPVLPERVEVVRLRERCSVGAARNAGLRAVRTPYVCFFDADDRMLPGLLRRLHERLERDARTVAAVAPFLAWDPVADRRRQLPRMPRPIVRRVSAYPRLFAVAGVFFNSFLVAGGMYRTAAVLDAGGFDDGDLGEDWVLAAALAFRGRFEFVAEPGFLHRTEAGSLWYRTHTRRELRRVYASVRRRIARDASVPVWGQAALRLARPVHALEIRRRTRGGTASPKTVFER